MIGIVAGAILTSLSCVLCGVLYKAHLGRKLRKARDAQNSESQIIDTNKDRISETRQDEMMPCYDIHANTGRDPETMTMSSESSTESYKSRLTTLSSGKSERSHKSRRRSLESIDSSVDDQSQHSKNTLKLPSSKRKSSSSGSGSSYQSSRSAKTDRSSDSGSTVDSTGKFYFG